MSGREVYTGISFTPQVIEDIRKMTSDCPNIYFGTPDYPIPPVACGRGCKVLEGECKNYLVFKKFQKESGGQQGL